MTEAGEVPLRHPVVKCVVRVLDDLVPNGSSGTEVLGDTLLFVCFAAVRYLYPGSELVFLTIELRVKKKICEVVLFPTIVVDSSNNQYQ